MSLNIIPLATACMLAGAALLSAQNMALEKPNAIITVPPETQEQHIRMYPQIHTPPEADKLFSCNDCSPQRRRWYSDISELTQAAAYCGYDYIEVRITQPFSGEEQEGSLTVYAHSLPDDSLAVDSAVTLFRSPTSQVQLRVVYRNPPGTICLPQKFPAWGATDFRNSIAAVQRHTATFTAGFAVRRTKDDKPVCYFTIDNTLYRIEDGNMQSMPLSGGDAGVNSGAPGYAEYRLATWGTSPLHPGVYRMEHGSPPVVKKFSVNDSLTLCRVSIECESPYGLYRGILAGTSHRDTIAFNGEKHGSHEVSFDASEQDSIITLEVTDIEGNSVSRSVPVFVQRRSLQAERDTQRVVAQMMKEKARENPLSFGMYCLSRFSGNPVSYISGKVLKYQAEEKMTATRDFTDEKPAALSFPCEGTIYPDRLSHAQGEYRTTFFADAVAMNDARIESLCNPVLHAGTGTPCDFSLTAPLMDGKYPVSWKIDTMLTGPVGTQPALLVCSDARYSASRVHLQNLPCILPGPSQQVRFALCYMVPDTSKDTLTCTCCVRYTDRSSDLLHYQLMFPCDGTLPDVSPVPTMLTIDDLFMDRKDGETCFIVPMKISGDKKIFRVDTFMHSLRENRTTGWGVVSCPG